jgi:(1->4)-alpha-D-glucan 1-alpha-D-glucosylmutase
MSVPCATMRLQLHSRFTLHDAAPFVRYFARLGISHLYLSPILTARPRSMHGYDVVDPSRVNTELGGEDALRQLVHELRRHEMGLIVDIVPNHMAVGSDNPWWMDVLAHGAASRFAKFFDIDWSPVDPQLKGKVALPILARPYGEALAAGEISLDKNQRQLLCYFEHRFPLSPTSLAALQPRWSDFDPGSADGKELLDKLIAVQHYRLQWWRSANDEINWRRFFDINELAAIRVEDEEVFDAVHATIFRLFAEGLIDGIRVDHIDGLSQPEDYCRKLRQRLRALQPERPHHSPKGPAYLVVEKILSRDEALPEGWATDGTTGYDFMDEVSCLQHDPRGERTLTNLWIRTSGRSGDFAAEEELARRQILQRSFTAQHEATVQALCAIAQSDLRTRDFSRPAIRRCLTEILAHFPVYRTYAHVGHASKADGRFLSRAVAGAKATCLLSDRWLVEKLGHWLSGERIRSDLDALQATALTRFQQLSAPLCAKAVEDTAFYRYGRLISRNDVGFDARIFACPVAEFHRRMQSRAVHLPRSMLTTSTHDHKRGEDVRARLAVLSELAEDWSIVVERWLELATPHRVDVDGVLMPSGGDLNILFQTIVGAWPLGLSITSKDGLSAYTTRITAWQEKALREAKLFTDWSAPNNVYEDAARDFITWLFSGSSDLLEEIAAFARRIASAGAINGLAQILIKLTAPGVPDIYQGTEYWDLSLVDPDNRSPVNFAEREQTLDVTSLAESASSYADGRVKQWTIARLLAARRNLPELFFDGEYLPLPAIGPFADHVVAFARILGNTIAVTAASLRPFRLLAEGNLLTIPCDRWQSTAIVLPPALRGTTCRSVLQRGGDCHLEAKLDLSRLFDPLPIAFLISQK